MVRLTVDTVTSEIREVDQGAPAARSVAFATVNDLQDDPHAETVILPPDELALRRLRKQLGQLSRAQIYRVVEAIELREKATQGDNDEA